MGNNSSKSTGLLSGKSKKVSNSANDGCIGDRKVRTITFSMILIAFMALGLAYFLDQQENWQDLADIEILGNTVCEKCVDAANSWYLILVGAFTVIASAVFAILLFFINCDDKVGRVAGVGLIVGGLMYIIGWTWYISLYRQIFEDFNPVLSDEAQQRLDAMLAGWFGEALLPAASSILLGVDVFMHLFSDEAKRLFTNLGTLLVVSLMTGPIYYILSEDEDDFTINDAFFPFNSDAYPWIATGYMVIGGFSFAYIVLFVCTCCTCNCKDTKVVRLLMALGLIVGGVLASIGYYIYAGEFTSDNTDDGASDYTLYYIGVTVAVGGFPIVWALDIGVNDIKK